MLKKTRGDLEVAFFFLAPKRSIKLLKSFLCPPPAVCADFRNHVKYTCFKSFAFGKKYDYERGGGKIMGLTTNIHPCQELNQ